MREKSEIKSFKRLLSFFIKIIVSWQLKSQNSFRGSMFKPENKIEQIDKI
jgi:uncharacterized protein YaaR (DUF327 family)